MPPKVTVTKDAGLEGFGSVLEHMRGLAVRVHTKIGGEFDGTIVGVNDLILKLVDEETDPPTTHTIRLDAIKKVVYL